MYAILAAAVAVVGALGVVNLVISLAIIRRLRVAEATSVWKPEIDDMPQVGTTIGTFLATTVDGETVTDRDLTHDQLFVGLLQPGCVPCGAFADDVERGKHQMPAGSLLVLVNTAQHETDSYVDRLRSFAQLVVLPKENPQLAAFGTVGAYPTFMRLESGVIAASDYRADRVLKAMAKAER